ncbi:molybdate ABC transporter substrate-binding protein [Hydrogenophaga sp.]|uniref:molybdate ABC transporter substrate-binding protein n=1 Tax=Hydrogenophaga sp. TaxID=1904254 RepID=UPI00286D88BC|nr:molybdate ABC transporter substrate-binding protein [Hydrogenophaga sp.]
MRLLLSCLSALLCAALAQGAAHAAEAQVAVAANFAEPVKALAAELHKTTGHTLKVTLGSTGKLYAQIRNGAPFDVLLAANAQVPEALERDGLAQPGSRFTYATGQLALWSAQPGRVDDQGAVLRRADLGKVAYAAPKVAPYGAAALEAMERLGLSAVLAPKLVQGESIGQAFGFVFTGNADVGFVALSQVWANGRLRSGSVWRVPPQLYSPIRQDAVLLRRGAGNEAALALLQLLQSPSGRALIAAYGYQP